MVVLGTTIHEFACRNQPGSSKLVDSRTKSDHDDEVRHTGGERYPFFSLTPKIAVPTRTCVAPIWIASS
jgi:hypothetical protein